LKDFLIDNYSVEEKPQEEKLKEIKMYDLKDNTDPKKVTINYEGDLLFTAS